MGAPGNANGHLDGHEYGLDGQGPLLSAVNGHMQCATAVLTPTEAVWTCLLYTSDAADD